MVMGLENLADSKRSVYCEGQVCKELDRLRALHLILVVDERHALEHERAPLVHFIRWSAECTSASFARVLTTVGFGR